MGLKLWLLSKNHKSWHHWIPFDLLVGWLSSFTKGKRKVLRNFLYCSTAESRIAKAITQNSGILKYATGSELPMAFSSQWVTGLGGVTTGGKALPRRSCSAPSLLPRAARCCTEAVAPENFTPWGEALIAGKLASHLACRGFAGRHLEGAPPRALGGVPVRRGECDARSARRRTSAVPPSVQRPKRRRKRRSGRRV